MIKKLKSTLILFAFVFGFLIDVHADLIVGPQNDEFYQENELEIYSLVRLFEAEKDIDVVKNPKSEEILTVIKKGTVIRVDYCYTDDGGQLWGMQKSEDDSGLWFSMTDMVHIKDQHDFWDEHPNMKSSNEIISFNKKGYLILWEYPNSGMVASAPPTSVLDREQPIKGGVEYIDENGTRWVQVSIDFRTYLGWLNMDEPISRNVPKVVGYSIRMNEDEQRTYSKEMLIGGLVIGVCVLTTGLTGLRRKRG